MTQQIMACIDGSNFSRAVCDAAAWASLRLSAPLTFVHVIDKEANPVVHDSSGQIGLGSREHLLEELAALDEQRGKIAQQQGRLMLEAACQRATEDGVSEPSTRQRNGEVVEALYELESEIRLLVLGKRGESAASASAHLGSNLERVVRALHCPILITVAEFTAPQRVLIAFDGSETAHKAVEKVASSPLLAGLECHVVLVGVDTEAHRTQLTWVEQQLEGRGGKVITSIQSGEIELALRHYKQLHGIDMLVMGAYGHSRIRHLLVGSTTTDMIRHASVPILIIR
ncbi:universal stress protein [Modicisalibacter luteus]|uniref:Universal stress protein n=1 Tax=Modicisalibacter luteus TaxID=453962 RepID=A0ABV7M357_9GAMM|nr:universal stress protein [Halomonas lutea]GHB14504.1 universal stress protein UspA [Halomonas lutea]